MRKYRFECGCEFDVRDNGALFFNTEDIPQSCPAVWELLEKGLTTGVFQLETSTGRTWSMKLKPTNINHLSALGAILRPGCLNSKMEDGLSLTEHYCMRKNGQEEPIPIHPELEDILRGTYQILVYQEQSLEILKKLGGFSLVEADLARRGIGKKDSKIVSEVEELFLKKCKEIGKISDEDARRIFGLIKAGERYSFNQCLDPSSVVITNNGPKILDEIQIGDKVLAPKNETEDEFVEVSNVIESGEKEVYEIELEDGETLICTLDHKLMCEDMKMRTLKEILENDFQIMVYNKEKFMVIPDINIPKKPKIN